MPWRAHGLPPDRVKYILVVVIGLGISTSCVTAALRARHTCIQEASVAKVLGQHPDCVSLIDGPTCTETTVRDGGCKDARVRNFTLCGAVLYHEVEDPEPPAGAFAATQGRSFSNCAYSPRPAGSPCDPDGRHTTTASGSPTATPASSGAMVVTAATAAGAGVAPNVVPAPSPSSSLSTAAAAAAGRRAAAAAAATAAAAYVCGGGGLRGMCVPAGFPAPEHEQCAEFTCDKGLCGLPVPTNEGGECAPPGPGPAPPAPTCQRRACRSGRCIVEALPDATPCGPAGPCGEHLCVGGVCVRNVEEEGVICGPSSPCADRVCVAGECVEERRPDGKLCFYTQGGCPRMCTAGRCVACSCGPAYAFWAGRQRVPGFHWTPFPTDLRENSFGGYFNLLAEELDIPPVQLPYNNSSAASRRAAETAILVCSGCRLDMKLLPGSNMVQGGSLVTGSVGLAASPVRDGTYVTLDVVMAPNVSHHHLLVAWYPWTSVSPPPLNSPLRWGNLSAPHLPSAPSLHAAPPLATPTSSHSHSAYPHGHESATTDLSHEPVAGWGPMPQPLRHHSAWAFVHRRSSHWAFTAYEQVRSVFVGLHLTVASCSKAPPLSAAVPSPPGGGVPASRASPANSRGAAAAPPEASRLAQSPSPSPAAAAAGGRSTAAAVAGASAAAAARTRGGAGRDGASDTPARAFPASTTAATTATATATVAAGPAARSSGAPQQDGDFREEGQP